MVNREIHISLINSIQNRFHSLQSLPSAMVYFVCNKCQETLRKNKVEGHGHSCHSDSFSCVDCNKIFDLQTFKDHKTCITEEEKYQGKLYNPKKVCLF